MLRYYQQQAVTTNKASLLPTGPLRYYQHPFSDYFNYYQHRLGVISPVTRLHVNPCID